MTTLLTVLGFAGLTALSMLVHLRRSRGTPDTGAREGAGGARARPGSSTADCPRCRAPLRGAPSLCPRCGVPLQAYELVSAPVVTAGPGAAAAGESPGDSAGSGRLHAVVRGDVCVGCGTCVAACPEPGALRIEHKLAVVDLDRCQGHADCVAACPVSAIIITSGAAVQRVAVPMVDAHFESNVPGIYVVGELGGRGLIKNAINEGKIAVEHIAHRLPKGAARPDRDPTAYDVLIVGSGPAGLSAGLEAKRAGLGAVILEQGSLSDSIRKYPRRKLLLAEPVRVPLYGNLWVADASKEELLQIWETMIANARLDVRCDQRVERVERAGRLFQVSTGDQTYRARRVVLAMGRRGTPRRLGVPGEELEKVLYDIVEMEAFAGTRVVVVGGGDSAVESALGLANQPGTSVTLSYRGEGFTRIKERNRAKLAAAVAAGRVALRLQSELREIRTDAVVLEEPAGCTELANDFVIIRIGGELPYPFLERIGVRIVGKEIALAPPAPAKSAATAGHALALLGAIAALTLAPAARAQLSPGPLAAAHQELDGNRSCFKCHAPGNAGSMDGRCLACHRDVAWTIEHERGLHGREPKAARECAHCHPDHAGRDLALVRWDEGSAAHFNHGRTGFLLQGKHQGLDCRQCHQPTHQRSPAAALIPRRDPGRSYLGLEPECASCHQDVHAGALGSACVRCHDSAAWKPAPRFDHAVTDFPLTGKHATTACVRCHLAPPAAAAKPTGVAGAAPVPRYRPVAHAECSACHADPHGGRLGAACASCHATTGFQVVRTGAFDHRRTRYPLTGRHAEVACARCHDPRTAFGPKPVFTSCNACHRDPHAGQATIAGKAVDCAACHREDGFRPSTYTAAMHQTTAYPLAGRHAAVACRLCHGRELAPGAPARGSAAVAFRPAHAECSDCHSDPHAGRFSRAGARPANGCRACHSFQAFRPAAMDFAMHATTSFPLAGAHRAVACQLCHRELERKPPVSTLLATAATARPLRFEEKGKHCADCHASPHGDQFSRRKDQGACESCHGLEAFVPASLFDHDREATFPLTGAHARAACTACHRAEPRTGKSPRVVYYPVSHRCESCHAGGAVPSLTSATGSTKP